MKALDLRKVKDCRFYLENYELQFADGERRKVSEVILENGKKLKFKDMNDSEAVQYANQLYEELGLPSEKARMI